MKSAYLLLTLALTGCSEPQSSLTDADFDGVTVEGGDCDDTNGTVYPGAPEQPGNGWDDDCDGLELCFQDVDADGSRTEATTTSSDLTCAGDGLASAAQEAGDCDDADPSRHPGATEGVDDGVDQDCDGRETCYADADRDGFRTTQVIASADMDCLDDGEAGTATPAGDCDDRNASVNPGADELVGNGRDDNCDGGELCFADRDGDGARTEEIVTSTDRDCSDHGEALVGAPSVDCDDEDPQRHPGAVERIDSGRDEDCDGLELCYQDADGDGYRTETTVGSEDLDCLAHGEAQESTPAGDCDDESMARNPGAEEILDSGADEDCDGFERCYADADNDGYRTDAIVTSAVHDCVGFGVAKTNAPDGDCADDDDARHPGAAEVCGDAVDQDCNGHSGCTDPACAADLTCLDLPGAMQSAYVLTCCQWEAWGYDSQASCEADAVTWLEGDCLMTQATSLDPSVQDCLLVTTREVATCLREMDGCASSAVDACWEAWSADAGGCGPDGWFYELCPPVSACDGGQREFGDDQRCDGAADCEDGLDELECFACEDGTRVPAEFECDAIVDCAGGDDERTCHTCADGTVIPESWRCDGVADCLGDQDEIAPTCFTCEPDAEANQLVIDQFRQCDGVPDCPNADDEALCDAFVCGDNHRVPWETVCDGVSDCPDSTDEAEATCPTFQCGDGTVVPLLWQCDGYEDCSSGSDELACPTYTCFDGMIIPDAWRCDAIPDCAAEEDEQRCGMACENIYDGSSYIPEQWVCDGIDDCVDNVDEYCTGCGDGVSAYHDSRNCDDIQDCATALDERCGSTDGVHTDAYLCSDGTWIYRSWLCDGEFDCPNGEDEAGLCFSVPTCPSLPLIHATQYCDGEVDCLSGDDELDEVCAWESFTSPPVPDPGAGADCAAIAWGMCNGIPECGADIEHAADEVGCGLVGHRCTDGTPFATVARCDGFHDCPGGEDESSCPGQAPP